MASLARAESSEFIPTTPHFAPATRQAKLRQRCRSAVWQSANRNAALNVSPAPSVSTTLAATNDEQNNNNNNKEKNERQREKELLWGWKGFTVEKVSFSVHGVSAVRSPRTH